MKQTEFESLLDRHGPMFSNWPEAVRGEAEAALQENPGWQIHIEQAKQLEQSLAAYQLAPGNLASLQAQIMAKTANRKTTLDQLLDWLLPTENWWRPALAACLPVALGLSLGMVTDLDGQFTLEEELAFSGLAPVTWEIEE